MKIKLEDLEDNVWYYTQNGECRIHAPGALLKKIYTHPRIVEQYGVVESVTVEEYAKEKEEI
jgi:hypothetical protein